MARIGKQRRFRVVINSEDEWGATASLLTALWCDVFSEVGKPIAPEGEAVILVTKKDGTTTALNIDRIERVELNPVSLGRESNVFLVGGAHLVVEEPPEVVIEQIVDAKARVTARAFAMPEKEWRVPAEPPGPVLRVVPTGGDDE
ncbi:MAG: flagellar FlbD family protein [Acidimicrobiales bacterium]|jgi:uncharacterized protein YlzI (FlbEa/FlbD family)